MLPHETSSLSAASQESSILTAGSHWPSRHSIPLESIPTSTTRPLSAHPLFNAMTDSRPSSASSRVVENGHSTGEPVNSKSLQPLVDQLISIQKGVDEMRQSQAQHGCVLQRFIQDELQRLQDVLVSEVKAANEESLGVQKAFAKTETHLDAILHELVPKVTSQTDQTIVSLDKFSLPDSVDDWGGEQNAKPQLKGATTKKWEEFQEAVQDFDPNCVYKSVLEAKQSQEGFWHRMFRYMGNGDMIYTKAPVGLLPSITEHPIFLSCQTLLILSNTVMMGYETDQSIKAALMVPKEEPPQWLNTCNLVFNLTFAAELLFRMIALGSWFWVSPADWGWNFFDLFLVAFSLVSDLISGVNLSFIRTLRILRAVRVARIIRVLRFFRQLRQMLFSILACLSSLAWAFVFLAMIMFMFSILFLQGAVNTIDEKDLSTDLNNPHRLQIEKWFSSLADAMLSLLATVTGGADWLDLYHTLRYSGVIYSIAYVIYMLFITTGVMNVLTGVFLSSADEFIDLDLIVQNEKVRIENFCEQMLTIFTELDPESTGIVDWQTFSSAMMREDIRAYLASLGLEPTHIHLLFDLLDEDKSGFIKLDEFVMGMVRLKGEAKSIDARIIQREIGMLPQIFKDQVGKLHRKLAQR